jgi:uncharacterized protein (TIGR01620 family)
VINKEDYQHQDSLEIDLTKIKQASSSYDDELQKLARKTSSHSASSKSNVRTNHKFNKNEDSCSNRTDSSNANTTRTEVSSFFDSKSELDNSFSQASNASTSSTVVKDGFGNNVIYSEQDGFEVSNDDIRIIKSVDNTDVSQSSSLDKYEDEQIIVEEPRRSVFFSPMFWFMVVVVVLALLQAYYFVVSAINSNSVIGIAWLSVLFISIAFFTVTVIKELYYVVKLDSIEKHQQELCEIIKSNNFEQTFIICKKMAQSSNQYSTKQWAEFVSRIDKSMSSEDVLLQYQRVMLEHQDRLVKKIIIRRSVENGMVVALSPLAWLDMLFTFARSLRLIREISQVYGYRCGYWGRVYLYRRVIKNLIFIGVADLATDSIVDAIGAGITTKLTAQLGQGVAATVYSTRLGYMTAKMLRPIPLSKEVMSLSTLRKEALLNGEFAKLIKDFANDKK